MSTSYAVYEGFVPARFIDHEMRARMVETGKTGTRWEKEGMYFEHKEYNYETPCKDCCPKSEWADDGEPCYCSHHAVMHGVGTWFDELTVKNRICLTFLYHFDSGADDECFWDARGDDLVTEGSEVDWDKILEGCPSLVLREILARRSGED